MPKNHSNEVIIEAIKWLNEIGCDEPLCIDKQSSHNLISDKYNINDEKKDLKYSNDIDLEKIDTMKSLEQYLLSKNIISDSNIPFYSGSEKADLMVIGDKPEDFKKKRPFQGKVETLLDAMLKAISFDKTNTYYTNLYFTSRSQSSKLVLEIIKKQITIVKPKVIIMFGAEVTKILSNTEDSIFHTRGKWYDIYIDDNFKSVTGISMFHPRYILANNESKKETWSDLKDIRKKLS